MVCVGGPDKILMALYYIVDGYNVIHSHRDRFPGSIESGRQKLLSLISVMRPQGSSRNRIKVVFDGQPGVSSPSEGGGVDVRFTSGSEADDLIKKLVAGSRNPKQIVVVTDDRAIKREVSAGGASTMTTGEFIQKLFEKTRKTKFVHPESGFDPQQITGINKELEELWVKKKKPAD